MPESSSVLSLAIMAKAKSAAKSSSGGGEKKSGGGSAHSLNHGRRGEVKGHTRSAATVKRLKMYRSSGAKRNREGKIIRPAAFQSHVECGTRARVEPSRSWFANSKTITQERLQKFQKDLKEARADPYKVIMKKTGLPVSLLSEKPKAARAHLLETESFGSTFGKGSTRKRPRIATSDLSELAAAASAAGESYDSERDRDLKKTEDDEGVKERPREYIFSAGQSKRIWNELYKVIDSSDVVVQVLDGRDPMGTRSKQIENYMRKEKAHKHLIFVLNKIDLVPTWVTQRWVSLLSQEYPTVPFHASLKNPFGKGAVINLLRQFSKLHGDSKQISVGFIGYPNVGKSSVINALRSKKVCNVAPIAGETKVWQYITLMKKIYLIDCPGVVYPTDETDEEKVLKGVVRVELVEDPSAYIQAALDRVRPEYMGRTYKVDKWEGAADFLEQVAQKCGKLLRGGEPDVNTVSKMVLNDFQRGKLPYFVPPPGCETRARGEDGAVDGPVDLTELDNAEEEEDIEEEEEHSDEKEEEAENESSGKTEEEVEAPVVAKKARRKESKNKKSPKKVVKASSGKFVVSEVSK